jgi:hypothetical protein
LPSSKTKANTVPEPLSPQDSGPPPESYAEARPSEAVPAQSRIDATFEGQGSGPLLRQYLFPGPEEDDAILQASIRKQLFERAVDTLIEIGPILEKLPPEAKAQRTMLFGLANELRQADPAGEAIYQELLKKEMEFAQSQGHIQVKAPERGPASDAGTEGESGEEANPVPASP